MENFEQKVLFLLVMRYSLDTYRSFSAINDWLSRHPQQSINELYNLLSRGRVILRRGILFALNRREIEALALRMHSEQGVGLNLAKILLAKVISKAFNYNTEPDC